MNYNNYPKNYNYPSNKLPNVIMPQQNMSNYNQNNLYNPYEGFIRGNMFRNLYDPYKNEKPFQIQPMNEQAEMLTNLDSLGFAMIDLNLYLDVFPDDRNSIELFNQYRKQHKDLLKQYENKYGPIVLSSDAMNVYPWAWDNKPWPWEN